MENRRNGFLDVVRTVALLRVVVWHTYGYVWLSYFVASLPAMFFVAGSLMAQSLDRASAAQVELRRMRRLLIPFWVAALIGLTVMLAYDLASDSPAARVDPVNLIWWALPIWDPRGSDWGLTWWAPLWYVRCIVWLLLASPVLLWIWRINRAFALAIPLAGLAITELVLSAGWEVPWQAQDIALFGFFWILGFAYNDGAFAGFTGRQRGLLCGIFAVIAAAWALTQDVPADIVNASYPLHLFVGMAWLFGALTFEDLLGRLALRRRLVDALYLLNQRALTIYLWHPAGLLVMYQILWVTPRSSLERALLALPIVTSVTFLAILAFGWLEDVAADRKARFLPLFSSDRIAPDKRQSVGWLFVPGAAAVGLMALVIAIVQVADDPTGLVQVSANTVPASGVGLHLRAQNVRITSGQPARPGAISQTRVTTAELEGELQSWFKDAKLAGAEVSLLRASGENWNGVIGAHGDDRPFALDEQYWAASVTKTFTTALIMRLTEEGLVDLNEPAGRFLPDFPNADRFTIRQLIQHTSGLVAGDAAPYDAVLQAAEEGLQFEPGTSALYSRVGYYLLALIIEDVRGRPYASVLRDELLGPLGLLSTVLDEDIAPLPYSTHPYSPERVSYPGIIWTSGGLHREFIGVDYHGELWSSAGLYSTTSDLARWALALWGSEQVVSATSLEAMTTFLDVKFDFAGLATYAFCPCWMDKGALQAERWGHLGANGLIEYAPADQTAIAIRINGSIVDEGVQDALDDLSSRLRRLIRGRAIPGN